MLVCPGCRQNILVVGIMEPGRFVTCPWCHATTEFVSKEQRMKPLISSIRAEVLGGHVHIHVWNRGGKAGTLVVDKKDASKIVSTLTGIDTLVEWVDPQKTMESDR